MTIKSFYRAFRKASKSFNHWNTHKTGSLWAETPDTNGVTIDVCPINAVYNKKFNEKRGLLSAYNSGKALGLSTDDITLIMKSADRTHADLTRRERQVKDALIRAVNS